MSERDVDWFWVEKLVSLVRKAPGYGMRVEDARSALRLPEFQWRKTWGLAYGRKLIDFCGGFIVATPARRREGVR